MTITAAQVRQARALLRWTSPRLSRAAGIGFDTALKAQSDGGMSALPFMDVWAIRVALEKAGIRFEIDPDGQPCAMLSKAEP